MNTWNDTESTPDTGWHPVNVTALVMGVAFAGLVTIWAVYESGSVAGADLRWLLPIPWLAAGAVGLAVTLILSRRSEPATFQQDAWKQPEVDDRDPDGDEGRDFLGERIDEAAAEGREQDPENT